MSDETIQKQEESKEKTSAQATEKEAKKAATKKKKKKKRAAVPEGKAYIDASYNNTIVTITDLQGNALCWASTGTAGFSGTKKSTPYAAQVTASKAAEKAMAMGMERVHVVVKGPGNGREQAIRGLNATGLDVLSIIDVTPIPHNGCRKRKARRV